MSTKSRRIVGLCALLAANAAALTFIYWKSGAGRPDRARVIAVSPTDAVDDATRLTLSFDTPIVPADAVGKAAATAPFEIIPSHPGEWAWAAVDRLEFRLRKPLHPGMEYVVRPGPMFRGESGLTLVGETSFTFATRRLEVFNIDLEGADASHLTARVRFNQPVEPQALVRATSAKDAGAGSQLDVACLSRSAGEELVLRIARPSSNQAIIRIDPRLVGSGATRALQIAYSQVLELEMPFGIEGVETWPSAFEKQRTVRIDFNRPLKAGQPAPVVRFEPPVGGARCDVEWDDLTIRAEFACGTRYKAVIAPGLLDKDGKPLDTEQVVSFEVPDREESLRFPIRRGVLSPEGNLSVDLRAVNCDHVRLVVAKLHENNLVAHLRGEDADATSRTVVERDLTTRASRNVPTTIGLDLRELVPSPGGIYHLEARSKREFWTRSSTIVAITDIGLSCKRERDGLFIWATSLRTATPLDGVAVSVLTYNNQSLATATTDELGRARLDLPATSPDGAPYVVVARRNNDLNYCRMDEPTWVPDDIDLAGRTPPPTHDVMLYAERGVYRPGDVIHLTGVIRNANGTLPPPFPIWVRTRRPDGKETGAETVMPRPENQGMFHVDVHTREDDQLGEYRFTATLPGSDKKLGETKALVEAFLPIRLELDAAAGKETYTGDEKITLDVDARYLFGKPASDVAVAVTGSYRESRFESDRYTGFRFGRLNLNAETPIKDVADSLDSTGHRTLTLNRPTDARPALWRGKAVVTVTETGSRSVSKAAEFQYSSATRHLGLLASAVAPASGAPVELKWVQVSGDETPAEPRSFELSIARIEHDWIIQEVAGESTWKTIERRIPVVKSLAMNMDHGAASGSTEISFDEPGRYVVTACEAGHGSITEIEIRAHDQSESRRWATTANPERVELSLTGKSLEPGMMAECIIQAPFAGYLLLAVEDDRVRSSKVIEIQKSPTAAEIAIPEGLRGDAFLTATLVRAIDPTRTKWLPNAARGIVRVPITHPSHVLPVELTGPADIGPRQCARYTVRAAPPSDPAQPPVVHLWAVDDGILLTTAFDSPDPLQHYFGPRKLDVESTDMFASLLPDISRPRSLAKVGADAGDDGDDSELRRSPVATKRREPAVVWLASRPTDADGLAEFDLEMPDLSGRMRVMAVAVDGDRYGHASRDVRVSSPLMIEAGWPRFLAPGDACRVPVKLFNASEKEMEIALEAVSVGGVTAEFESNYAAILVVPETPTLVWLKVTASEMGPAEIELWAHAKGEEPIGPVHSTVSFPVRPATALDTVTTIKRLIAGERLMIEPAAGFLSGTTATTIEIDASKDVELRPAVEQLLDYPYGCVEQTSSRMWALLEAGKLVRDHIEDDSRYGRIDDMIRAGIARLWSMQTADGGLSYWPGSSTADRWGSTYACAVLAEAASAGFKLDPGFQRDLLRYLENALGESELKDENVRAMICESLAAFDRPNLGWMARLSERTDKLDLGGRAALARAWHFAGERDRARAVLPTEIPQMAIRRSTGGRITSDITQIAALARAIKLIDPDSPSITPLIERVRQATTDGRWGTTLENATVIAALANLTTGKQEQPDFTGHLLWDGETIEFDHRVPMRFAERQINKPVEIQTAGTGDMLVHCRQTGLRDASALKSFDRGLRVTREWLDSDGNVLTTPSAKVGDLLTARVTIATVGLDENETIENVAIVDALPAGFEIENPRLATSANTGRLDAEPDHVQFHDDRTLLFTSARRGETAFEYHIRAVTPGSYVVPPIEASCMYDGNVASLKTGGRVEVLP